MELAKKLKHHEYFPSLPLTVKEADKGFSVARQIPIFNLEDYSVYYYCVRKLEHVLAKNRIKGTYGGWSMGGKLRNLEDFEDPGDEYSLTYSYNPAAWSKYYGDFNARLYGKIKEIQDSNNPRQVVFELDIANYYDNIQLSILENKIRQDADYSESGILDLLMYFLGYSNRLVTHYQKRSVGIPQDAFGDCSRLLANYYLQDYDLFMNELTKQHGASYFRYADDQIIFVPSDAVGHSIIQLASRKLAQIGLNFNQQKVARRTLDELYTYRSFDINDIFQEPNSKKDATKVNEFAYRAFEAIDQDVSCLKNRGYPLIKRLLNAEYNLLSPTYRARLMAYVFDKEFTKAGKAYNFRMAYEKMYEDEKNGYLILLNDLLDNCSHSAFHYEILTFYRQLGLDTERLENRIAELKKDIYSI